MSLKPLSKTVIGLTKPLFQRKYIKLGRIYSHWEEIIGKEFLNVALPLDLHSRADKKKGGLFTTLTILTDSGTALALSYQKERILGRIEHIFGEALVNDLKIIQGQSFQTPSSKTPSAPLNTAKKEEISTLLEKIDDESLRRRLEDFATSLYHSVKQP